MPFPYTFPFSFEKELKEVKKKIEEFFGRLVFAKELRFKIPIMASVHKKVTSTKFLMGNIFRGFASVVFVKSLVKKILSIKTKILSRIKKYVIAQSELVSKVGTKLSQETTIEGRKSYETVEWLLEDDFDF